MRNSEFCHLHIHDQYSLLDGFGSAEQYCKKAKELGFKYMAITNHGNVDGCIKWQQACEKAGIQSLLGCEAYIVQDLSVKEKGEKRQHVTILVENNDGWKNLLKMLTIANIQGFYGKPRIDPDLLLDHLDGFVILTGCGVGFITEEWGIDLFLEIQRRASGKLFIEVMPHDFDIQYHYTETALMLHEETGVPMVASNDCHYVKEEDSELHEVLLAMQTRAKWNDKKRWKFDITGLYLRSADELLAAFKGFGRSAVREGFTPLTQDQVETAMRNTMTIAEMCSFSLKPVKVVLPKIEVTKYPNMEPEEQFTQLTLDGFGEKANAHKWIKDDYAKYEERVLEELELIIELGFATYFLIVWELINWCKENGVMCGPGRGSVGSSLVAYCLGITSVDPIKYDLVFSRFISPARIDLPDIDMDFEDIKREKIKEHLKDLYGKHNVVSISTFAKMHGRGALRDVARVFDIPLAEVDKAAKSIVVRSGGDVRADFTLEDAFKTFEDGKKFYEKYPKVSKIAMAMEGQVKGCGTHAAAICVAKHDFRSGENAHYAMRSKSIVCNWDKEDSEYMGLMKLDVLGLNALSVLNETKKMVEDRHGVDIDFEQINLEDSKVLEEFNRGNNAGVFQLNSPGMMRISKEIGIEDFNGIVAINALHRPGCLRSGMITEYGLRKHGKKKIEKSHPFFEDITASTYGIVLYQEQVMRMLYDLGGLPWKTADTVRKVISKSKGEEQFAQFKTMFIQGCLDRGTLDKKEAAEMFDRVKTFGSYGFNKAHAVEYGMISYWDMWFKVYYPTEFLVSLLSHGQDNKKSDYLNEARRLNMKVHLPNVNKSEVSNWVADGEDNLLIPLCEIKQVGPKAANAIVEERAKGLFSSKKDFLSRVPKRQCNSKVTNRLDEVLAFSFGDRTELGEEKLTELSVHFPFDLSNDPMFKYRNMVAKIAESVTIDRIEGLDFSNTSKEWRLYFGNMDQVKFGYRSTVEKGRYSTSTGSDIEGTASSLGGVYGNFKDDSDFCMLIFGTMVYQERKEEVEHCLDKWLLAEANHPFRTSALHTNKFWLGDDLIEGKVDGLELYLAKETTAETVDEDLLDCQDCNLKQECTKPVLPSAGEYNIMIIGEAPGKQEDSVGKGFVGDSGELIFNGTVKSRKIMDGLSQMGIDRSICHVTNIVKCWPKETRTPKRSHVNKCSRWIEKEIRAVEPYIIFALGNTCNLFFHGEEKGIMNWNARTEWNNRYSCWICWGVHPATVLYSQANRGLFSDALENFSDKLIKLGFGLGAKK